MGKMFNKSKIALAGVVLALFSIGATAFAATPVTIEAKYMVRDLTTGQIDYTTSVNAKPGDTLRYMVWYHNTMNQDSGLNAKDLRIVAGLSNSEGTVHTSSATVAGSNTNSVTKSVTVNTTENTVLELISGTAVRLHNTGSNSDIKATTSSISDQVVNGSGFVVDDMKPCWNFQESIFFDVKVKEVEKPKPTPTPVPPVVTSKGNAPLPTSGPAESAAGAAGLTITGGAAYAWLRSKKALLSAITKIK